MDDELVAAHTADVDVPVAFAWAYWTNVANWTDPPASFSLEGPFSAGSRGTTTMAGTPTIAWTVLAAADGHATIEIPLERAAVKFAWAFEPLDDARTRMSQRITMCGPDRDAYLADARATLRSTILGGMARLAEDMRHAWEAR